MLNPRKFFQDITLCNIRIQYFSFSLIHNLNFNYNGRFPFLPREYSEYLNFTPKSFLYYPALTEFSGLNWLINVTECSVGRIRALTVWQSCHNWCLLSFCPTLFSHKVQSNKVEILKDHKIIVKLQISVTEISAYTNKILNKILKKKSKQCKKY